MEMKTIYLLRLEEEQKQQKEKYINRITDGYVILRDETLPFHEVLISGFGFTMLVPEAFDVMPEPVLAVKYPDEGRPHYVLSSAGTTMNLSFRQEEERFLAEETEAARDAVRRFVRMEADVEEMDGCKTIMAGETIVANFDFMSSASDSRLYNRMFLFSLKERMIFGNFSCLQQNRYEWKELSLQMLQSIKEL